MNESLQRLIDNELEQREELKHLVMGLVSSRCSIGPGFVKRGQLNQYIYEQLGFQGRPGNHFFRFMNKLMSEQGFRISYSRGHRVYFGLTWKEETCLTQPTMLDKNSVD